MNCSGELNAVRCCVMVLPCIECELSPLSAWGPEGFTPGTGQHLEARRGGSRTAQACSSCVACADHVNGGVLWCLVARRPRQPLPSGKVHLAAACPYTLHAYAVLYGV
jgi:hypothetical protein